MYPACGECAARGEARRCSACDPTKAGPGPHLHDYAALGMAIDDLREAFLRAFRPVLEPVLRWLTRWLTRRANR